MTTDQPSALAVCSDCIMILANGECTYANDEAERIHHEGMAKHINGYEVMVGATRDRHEDGCDLQGCQCEDLGFSWRACDGCGSPLGGDRYAATLWLPS